MAMVPPHDPQIIVAAHAAAEFLREPLIVLGEHVGYDLVRTGAFRLWDRIRNDPDAARNAALRNARAYTDQFGRTLSRARDAARITDEQIARAIASPAAMRVLDAAIVTASTTDRSAIHADLATLVAARLATDDDSILGNLIHDACSKLESLKARHLRILAVVYLTRYADYEGVDLTKSAEEQGLQLLRKLHLPIAALGEPYFDYKDVRYIESLGLATLRNPFGMRNSSDDAALGRAVFGRIQQPGLAVPEDLASVIEWVRLATQIPMDGGANPEMVHLPLVGMLIGQIAFCRFIGEEPGLSTYS